MSSYIQIIVPEKFTPDQVKSWRDCVETCLTKGMIGSTPIIVQNRTRNSSYYHTRTHNHKHSYFIPLVRDLDLSEIHELVEHWCQDYPEGDFLIDYSQPEVLPTPGPRSLEQGKIDQVLDAWARHQHQAWMDQALAQGWKYGTKMSTVRQTHPWLQPWEQLPKPARARNLDGVQDLLKILDSFGYEICQKTQG